MEARTPAELGTAVRTARTRLGMTQGQLAEATGVSREWVSRLENGADRLEMGLVFRAMRNLGLTVMDKPVDPNEPTAADKAEADKIAWTMALEAQKLSDAGYDRLLRDIVEDRLADA